MMMTTPLYRRVMGDSWTQLAEPVRCAHTTGGAVRAHGYLRIAHGRSAIARLVARLLRLPSASEAAETRLIITANGDGEHWLRTFDGRPLITPQYAAHGAELAERFGILEVRFRLDVSDGSLLYVQRQAAFIVGSVRLRIPDAWGPRVEAREDPAGPRRVSIAVRVALPGIGPLITYDGIMTIEDTRA